MVWSVWFWYWNSCGGLYFEVYRVVLLVGSLVVMRVLYILVKMLLDLFWVVYVGLGRVVWMFLLGWVIYWIEFFSRMVVLNCWVVWIVEFCGLVIIWLCFICSIWVSFLVWGVSRYFFGNFVGRRVRVLVLIIMGMFLVVCWLNWLVLLLWVF